MTLRRKQQRDVVFYDSVFSHKKFGPLYKHVLSDLHALEIDSAVRYHEMRAAGNYLDNEHHLLMATEFGFARNVMSLYKAMERNVKEQDGISLLVDELVPRLKHGQLAKAIAFSETFYMLRSELTLLDVSMKNNEVKVESGPDIGGCIDVLFSHPADVCSGRIIPVPDSVNMLNLDVLIQRYHRADPNPFLGIDQNAELPNILQVKLNGIGLGHTNQHLQLGLVLPSLAMLPIETTRQLRQDFHPEFIRFQRALRGLTEGLKDATDERKLVLLLEHVESEVAALKHTIETRARRQKSLSALLTSVGIFLCFDVPLGQWTNALNALIGLGAGAGGSLFSIPGDEKNHEANPYYFPLRLHWEGLREAKKAISG